jgi:hypothetical protein
VPVLLTLLLQAAADGALAGEEQLRGRAADHHVPVRRQVVGGLERPAVEHVDLHRPEVVAGRERPVEGRAGVRALGHVLAAEAVAARAFVEGHVLDDPHRGHARERGQPIEEVEVEARPARAVLERGLLRRELEGEDVARVVAGIDGAQREEAAHQQPGPDQEHQRHRGLGRHQAVASEAPAPGRAAPSLAQAREVRRRPAPRGRPSAQDAGEERGQEGEEQGAAAQGDFGQARDAGGGGA